MTGIGSIPIEDDTTRRAPASATWGELRRRALAGSDEASGHPADGASRLHGTRGLVRGSTVERLFCEARALRLREGTREIVRLELAEAILKECR